MRRAVIDRRTTETQIVLSISLDGKGTYQVRTGIRFLDHMLELLARHGAFDLRIDAKGDLDVDQHHTVEDLGIALGEAVSKALGDRRGINRAGYFVMPMDETLAVAAIDLGGRPHAVVDLKTRTTARSLPLGALEETETSLLFDEAGLAGAREPGLPDAMGEIARRMELAGLILEWARALSHAIVSVSAQGEHAFDTRESFLVASTPADAWHLSGELANLIDELIIEDVAWETLDPLVLP